MNELLDTLRRLVRSRSPRERWLIALAGCALALISIDVLALTPLRDRAETLERDTARLEEDQLTAARLARQIRSLQAEVELVEEEIRPGEKTNLFTLIETLAQHARITSQLESIKPKQPSGNPRFPETRVEVNLKGATLGQVVKFLYEIEGAPMHLIVRSMRIKARQDKSQLLDVSFSVSSFERA